MEYSHEGSKKRKLEDASNGKDGEISEEDIRMLLEPLTKENIVNFLVNIGCQYPSIAEEIREVASKDPAHRKLFVRGLAWETTSETLCDAFRKHGEIEEGAVIIDKATGKSRGFGFVTFKHMDSAQRALKEPSKNVDGRITICNLASEGGSSTAASNDQAQRKLYIGGLPLEVTSETLLNVFSKYGEIEEGSVAYEKNTNKSRGFAFITFRTADAAKKAIDDPNKTLEGRHIIVKLAGEGQKNRFVPHTASVSSSIPVASTPLAYGTVNPNVGRTRVAGTAATPLGYSAYTPGFPAYPSSYPGLTTAAQYGTSSQYNATNAQYTAFPPQQGQLSLPAGSIPGGGVFSYYTGGT